MLKIAPDALFATERLLRGCVGTDIISFADRLRQIASGYIPVDSAYLARYDGEMRSFTFDYNYDAGEIEDDQPVIGIGNGPTSQVVLTGETFVLTPDDRSIHDAGTAFGDMARVSLSAITREAREQGERVREQAREAKRILRLP